ncbi:hypothetical protein SKAU_G00386430 [Synaphobranchus kaupii]|uniref:Protein kinase domain-containing protein n=1 Tax=Synaphobranchus kaupii TaxID=118154 RepID=A0A9Q1ID56_SYNKA|nr:hypothetical protein SKAU_G00386430 [Synaphobranchus kaupii]
MLEQRSLRFGRVGKICRDSFQQSFRQHNYVASQKSEMMKEDLLICPACHPNMLAVSADGQVKRLYKDVFFAKDEDVATFVETIQMEMKGRPGKGQCGTTAWAAAREASQKTSSRTDEEGIEIAVCRHGFLLRGLNMFRGEVFAYPLYLQKDLAKQHNISFFCTDQMCRYWPYLERVVGQFKDLGNLLSMKPVLSVLHAKAHTTKCEITWSGRNQTGAGLTLGEEVEQVNSFVSRVALTTKYMTKATRCDIITMHVFGWNARKAETLHISLSQRYRKTVQRGRTETENLSSLMEELNCSEEQKMRWVSDVQQWALQGKGKPRGSQEELKGRIEGLFVRLQQRKRDLYRQNDSNKQRFRIRKTITKTKKQLTEAISCYNEAVTNLTDKISCDGSNPDVAFIWPWEEHADGSSVGLGLRKKLFDQDCHPEQDSSDTYADNFGFSSSRNFNRDPYNLRAGVNKFYKKGQLLGRGGYGSVYAGTRMSDGLPVALKYARKDEELQLPGLERPMPKEVGLFQMVNTPSSHPNILKLFDWFDRPASYVMAMERPDPCMDLFTYCQEQGGVLDEDQARSVTRQLLGALQHCHDHGVVHRDVKPGNILIQTDTKEIKLIDFGCGDPLKDTPYTDYAGAQLHPVHTGSLSVPTPLRGWTEEEEEEEEEEINSASPPRQNEGSSG